MSENLIVSSGFTGTCTDSWEKNDMSLENPEGLTENEGTDKQDHNQDDKVEGTF